ncbi:MAG: Ig-like domain-containing protein [Bacteroidetes bacterium]|nr:Ig-like domain-containing protein [Bacteroidota bacterium]
MRKHFRLLPVGIVCLLVTTCTQAQVSITSTTTPYTQNFNTLITTGTSSVLPTGWRLLETGTNANTTLAADAGSTATGNTYSYGTGTATDRAFGGLLSGSLVPTLGVQITNNTGATITSLSISYTGEEWRLGTAGRADQLDFQYSLNATSLSTGTWTDFNALDFATPATATTGAKDGNAAANRTAKSAVITGLSIANGTTFWLRWNDLDASGADDGLAIDDFSIQLNGADVTPPTATTFTPANGATGVAVSGNLIVAFSENIQKGTAGTITVKRTSDNVTVQTTAVTAAAVTVSGNTATIPYSALANSTGYYVNIDAGAFRDLAGNNHAGITSTTTWAFTTVAGSGGGGTLNYYFGNLHAHSSYSDGNADNTTKIPADDYAYAKTALCMDFLGISEHNHATAGMSITNWQPGRTQAAAATTSTFVGMYGMEWGVISGGGHVIVYGMDSLIGWEAGNYDIFVAKSVYTGTGGLFDILNRHGGNALAYLAHPNSTDYNNVLGNAFDVNADNAIVGSAVESGPAFSTNTTYTNPGTSMSYLSYYRNMLSKGYHLGPTIDHDNHNMTFGHTAKTRLVVRAASLSENNLLDGMRKMRFYASQDCSAKIDFTISTETMGSVVTKAGAPLISVTSTGTTSAVSSVSVMFGVPGSGTAATLLTSSASGTFTYTDNALANGSQRYYYLDITEADGSRIVTAPIWYTRNDAAKGVAPESLTSFFAINEKDRVILKWTTENEEAGQTFEVQRSTDDGKNFSTLDMQNGRGASDNMQTYVYNDMQPFAGVAYYRLVQRNANGAVRFTDQKVIDRSETKASYYTLYPNPVQGILNIRVGSATGNRMMAEVFDMSGRRMITKTYDVIGGQQTVGLDMSPLHNGSYIIKITLDGKTRAQLVNKF